MACLTHRVSVRCPTDRVIPLSLLGGWGLRALWPLHTSLTRASTSWRQADRGEKNKQGGPQWAALVAVSTACLALMNSSSMPLQHRGTACPWAGGKEKGPQDIYPAVTNSALGACSLDCS